MTRRDGSVKQLHLFYMWKKGYETYGLASLAQSDKDYLEQQIADGLAEFAGRYDEDECLLTLEEQPVYDSTANKALAEREKREQIELCWQQHEHDLEWPEGRLPLWEERFFDEEEMWMWYEYRHPRRRMFALAQAS